MSSKKKMLNMQNSGATTLNDMVLDADVVLCLYADRARV